MLLPSTAQDVVPTSFYRRHKWLIAIVVGLFVCLASSELLAEDGTWPQFIPEGNNKITRGPGGYFSWWKISLAFGLYLLWVWVTDWVSRDCRDNDFSYAKWVPIVFFPFLVGMFAFVFSIPVFLAGFPLGVLAFAIPAIVYVTMRNRLVEPHLRVLTPDHIRYLLSKRGVMDAEKKAAHERGAPITFEPTSGKDEQANQASLITARQHNGFVPAKALIANALDHRANKILIDFTASEVASKFEVDGVWHDSDPLEREEGDQILEVYKLLGSMNPKDRKSRQQGKFKAKFQKLKLECSAMTQGTKTGERAIVTVSGMEEKFKTLEDLGMREQMVAQLKDLMLSEKGILLFSAMKGDGLTTTFTRALDNTDRLLRDFVSIEDKLEKMPYVENVDPVFFDKRGGQSPASVLEPILRKQPDVLVVPDLVNKESIEWLCRAAEEHQSVFISINAKEAVEALLRVLMFKVPANQFAPRVICVLNQRLVRKLCEDCKEAYEPPPALLKKLGIPAGRVAELFRHPEEPEKVCETCHGIGYMGRTAIFELLVVDDVVREVLIKQPKLEILRKAARKAGSRTLQEEGILAVIKGVTSLPELMRVLKK